MVHLAGNHAPLAESTRTSAPCISTNRPAARFTTGWISSWRKTSAIRLRGVKYMNFQFAYSLSRFVNSGSNTCSPTCAAGGDQDFVNNALDNRNPNALSGPGSLDRTHQFNIGGYADLPLGFRVGIVSHFWSPFAGTPFTSAGEWRQQYRSSRWNLPKPITSAPGRVGNPLPRAETSTSCGTVGGTCDYSLYKVGAFMRQIGPAGLTNAINNYNANIAGLPTPAGQALINAGLLSLADLAGARRGSSVDRECLRQQRWLRLAEGLRYDLQLGRACLA